LSGQLWIGRGFGDDSLLSEDDLKISGFELGCSDVPGWGQEQQKTPDNPAMNEKAFRRSSGDSVANTPPNSKLSSELDKTDAMTEHGTPLADELDGTDDHLHRPLQDSNPAPASKPGESADVKKKDKQRKPTHADIESLQESADIAGKIVMLSRGGCGFLEKVKWAQRRGGVALIVGDNERNGQLTIMYAKGDTSNVTIPAIFTSYTSAHLLSSLVPPELGLVTPADGSKQGLNSVKGGSSDTGRGNAKNNGPMFTTTSTRAQVIATSTKAKHDSDSGNHGWMQNVLQAVGFDDADIHEDSRRPPGMGNIEWVQVKDWDEDQAKTVTTGTSTSTATKTTFTSTKSSKQKSTKKAGDDDFVIGVQDWRDTELIAPKSPSTATGNDPRAKGQASSTSTGSIAEETALKGGSIIPGSGEYAKPDKDDKTEKDATAKKNQDSRDQNQCGTFLNRIKSWFGKTPDPMHLNVEALCKNLNKHENHDAQEPEREGLWVTLTPTSVSTSPFFDTLLVLVVSLLVTLTFVYGLLLLRSRIRRRRWRAPKSLVERLPVRTYHTMSTASSTTSSELASPNRSQAGSPQLRPEPVRARQRSQTTIGVLTPGVATSQSPSVEKQNNRSRPKPYRGRQVECVVCLEEYVDGESKVMSLPCGHEFHADCITPWLVNRRRTCPICKGDVVRSMQRQTNGESHTDADNREPGEETSDGVQERAATTVSVSDDSAAAIPIPDRPEGSNIMDEDIERGEEPPVEQENVRPIASRWRGILNASVSSLSGDTLWRSNSVDRNR